MPSESGSVPAGFFIVADSTNLRIGFLSNKRLPIVQKKQARLFFRNIPAAPTSAFSARLIKYQGSFLIETALLQKKATPCFRRLDI